MAGKHPPQSIGYFEWVRENLNKLVFREPSSREIIFLLEGYDAATGFSLFQDLLPWLVVRLGGGENFIPLGLLHAYASGAVLGEDGFEYPDGEDRALDADVAARIVDLVIEFLAGIFGEPKRATFRAYDDHERKWKAELEAELTPKSTARPKPPTQAS